MIIEADWLVLLATVAFIAGFVDTLAVGGLITIPAFLFAGFTPRRRWLPTNARPSLVP